VVLADFVQVAPERTVVVAPVPGNPDGFQVVVQGLIPPVEPESGVPIEVTVEERMPGTTDDLGWLPVAAGTPGVGVTPEPTPEGEPDPPLWFGRVGLPTGRSPGQYRIVIREFEPFSSDDPDLTQGRLAFAETVVP
jgi:hypothetical protein